MKRVLLYMLLVSAVAGASAQEAIYVYRNDGGFDAFMRADIDSITYSRIGADSLLHADWQMQLVHTPDSVYRIPLSVIDSVSLVKPEPVLNADVFLLTAAHDPYLVDADTLSFTLKAGTPASMRPAKGNVVVSAYDCMAFPHGIMARVLSVSGTVNGSLKYVCGKAGLEDIYDRLVVYEKCVTDEARQTAARSKAMGRIDASRDFTLWDSDFEQEITAGGTTTCISARDAATATITIKLIRGQSSYFRFDLRNDFKSSVSFNAKSTAGMEKEVGPHADAAPHRHPRDGALADAPRQPLRLLLGAGRGESRFRGAPEPFGHVLAHLRKREMVPRLQAADGCRP